MKTLARYLEVIVDPTFDDFYRDRGSVRLAYLACVAIFHAVDRAADESGTRSANLRQEWCRSRSNSNWWTLSLTTSSTLRAPMKRYRQHAPGYRLALLSGSVETGESMDLRNIYYLIRDAVRFVHKKAATTHPNLP